MKKLTILLCIFFICASVSIFAEGQMENPTVNPAYAGKSFTLASGLMKPGNPTIPDVLNEYKKITGVTMNLNDLGGYNEAKLNLLISTGDIPDAFACPAPSYPVYINSGILVELSAMIENSVYVKAGIPKKFLDLYRTKDGKIYTVPTQKGGGTMGYIRSDWLKKVGKKMPSNWAELYEVIKAFTTQDPDGNGKNDTFGYSGLINDGGNSQDSYNRFIFQDAHMQISYMNGKWVDGMLQPNFKAAMQRYHDLYKNGYIDQDIISNTGTGQLRTKFFEGHAGLFEYWAGEWGGNIVEYTHKVNPNAEVTPMPCIRESNYKERVAGGFSITTKAKDPQLIFDVFIEGFFDEGPLQTLFTYGVEGKHYKMGSNGYEYMPLADDPTRLNKKTIVAPELQFGDWYLIQPNPIVKKSLDVYYASPNMEYEKVIPPSELYAKYIGDINALKKEMVSKIIKGDLSVDEGLKQYTTRIRNEFKIDQMLTELNK